MSFLMIMSLTSFSVPGISKIIQGELMNLVYLDVLMPNLWLIPWMFPDDDGSNDYPFNPQFDQSGFNSMILIKNLGSTFIFVLGLIILFPVGFLMSQIKLKGCKKIGNALMENIKWKYTIILFCT